MGAGDRTMPSLEQNLAWTPRQRTAIAGLLIVLMVMIGWRAWRPGGWIGDPPPQRPERALRLADAIDPNTADLAMLATLPGVGEARAQAIIDYRTAHSGGPGTAPVFGRLDDLRHVPGFGDMLLEQLRPHLLFPAPAG